MVVMGRPREFDAEQALDKALAVFWRNGYEGASISDLTVAMGISPPSLYAAFGNKEELFRKTLDRYVAIRTKFWHDAMQQPTARGMVEFLFNGLVDFLTDECTPSGCMLVRGAASCGGAADAIAHELNVKRAEGEAMLVQRFEHAQRTGEIPADVDARDYARYLMTVSEGLSLRAAGGAGRQELRKIADIALRGWPAK